MRRASAFVLLNPYLHLPSSRSGATEEARPRRRDYDPHLQLAGHLTDAPVAVA